jgi:hypothetical protein
MEVVATENTAGDVDNYANAYNSQGILITPELTATTWITPLLTDVEEVVRS